MGSQLVVGIMDPELECPIATQITAALLIDVLDAPMPKRMPFLVPMELQKPPTLPMSHVMHVLGH
jgi:hypothetical protein